MSRYGRPRVKGIREGARMAQNGLQHVYDVERERASSSPPKRYFLKTHWSHCLACAIVHTSLLHAYEGPVLISWFAVMTGSR